MHTSIQVASILSILLTSSAVVIRPPSLPYSGAIGVRSADDDSTLRIPLNIHDTRQFSDDLKVRQEWLKQQGRGLRSKYSRHLGEDGKRLVERENREILAKRASGTAT